MCIRDRSKSPSALAEVKSFLEEYDLEEVARLYRSIRERLRTVTPTKKFLLLAEAAAAIGPVSYTHLDVYKRQVLVQ